jgi:hypothetical protein
MSTISIFKNVAQSSKAIEDLTVEAIFEIIRNHPNAKEIKKARELGKYDSEKHYKVYSYGKYEDVNYYDYIKRTKCPMVTWNASFDGMRRAKGNVTTERLSGYIYCDVDSFEGYESDGIGREKVYKRLVQIPFVKAVWKSYGGKGFGFLVKTENLTVENFETTWKALEALFKNWNITIDAATKDTTRPNVLSSDSDIFIRDDNKVRLYRAVEPAQIVQKKEKTKLSKDKVNKTLDSIIERMYSDRDNWSNGRLAYKFYVALAGAWRGLNSDVDDYDYLAQELVDYLSGKTAQFEALFGYRNESEVYNIIRKICLTYTNDTEYYVESITEEVKVKESNVVPNGKYLSDVVDVRDIQGKCLVAPVGLGKTQLFIRQYDKFIFVVPSQLLCDNNLKDNPTASVFHEHKKTVNGDSTKIFTTYASLPNLVSLLGERTKDFHLALDEVHNFVTSTSKSYAHKQYTKALECLLTTEFKSESMMTATPFKFSNVYLNTFDCVEYKRETSKDISLSVVKVKDSNEFISSQLEGTKAGDNFVAVLLNNKKKRLDKVLAIAENCGINMSYFNADNKNDVECQNMIGTGQIKSDMNAFVSTTVFNAGVSLKLNDKRNGTVKIIVMGNFSTTQIYQFCDRIRDSRRVEIVVLKNDTFEDKKIQFNASELKNQLVDKSLEEKHALEYLSLSFRKDAFKTSFLENVHEQYVIVNKNGYVDVDYCLIDNEVYNKQTIAENKDISFLRNRCEALGINFKGVFTHTDEMKEEEKIVINGKVEEKQMEREISHELLVDEIRSQGQKVNQKIVDDKSIKLSEAERFTRFKFSYLWNLKQDDDSKVFSLYDSIGGESKQKWNTFKKRINVEKIKQGVRGTEDDKAFVEAMCELLSTNETYYSHELSTIVNETINKYRKTEIVSHYIDGGEVITKSKKRRKVKLTPNQTITFLKQFFNIKRKSVRVNGDVMKKYVLCNLNLGLTFENKNKLTQLL